LFQGDNGKRSKQQFIDLFSSFPNYVAFSFGYLQLFCEISCQLAYDVVYRQQMKITREIGDRTGETLGQFNLAAQDHRANETDANFLLCNELKPSGRLNASVTPTGASNGG
jgi:hypothetical protein